MQIQTLSDGLYSIAHPFRMPGGIELGVRATIVRLDDGGLWIHSPGPFSAEEIREIRELGPVHALVAPNRLHHLSMASAHAAFPDAAIFAAPGMQQHLEGLPAAEILGAEAPALWKGQIEQLPIDGAERLNEIVFFHPRTRTLLLTDLCFNLQRGNRRTAVFLSLNRAWKRFGPSRLARTFMKDRAAVARSVEQVLRWDFDRVTVTHGDVLETGGAAAVRAGFDWLLK